MAGDAEGGVPCHYITCVTDSDSSVYGALS